MKHLKKLLFTLCMVAFLGAGSFIAPEQASAQMEEAFLSDTDDSGDDGDGEPDCYEGVWSNYFNTCLQAESNGLCCGY